MNMHEDLDPAMLYFWTNCFHVWDPKTPWSCIEASMETFLPSGLATFATLVQPCSDVETLVTRTPRRHCLEGQLHLQGIALGMVPRVRQRERVLSVALLRGRTTYTNHRLDHELSL